MIFKKKSNEIFLFEDEQEFKDYCSNNKSASTSMFSDFLVSKYNKKTNRFDKIKSNKL